MLIILKIETLIIMIDKILMTIKIKITTEISNNIINTMFKKNKN